MGRPALRHEDGRTNGDARHARRHNCDGAVDGSAPRFAVHALRSIGDGALALLLVAEFGLALWLRGLSIREYLATRDPVSGTVYYVMVFGSPVCQLCARF